MNELYPLLAKAIRIVAIAHEGQTDRAGVPYILHPLRVMDRLESFEEKIVAVLHDLLEDTPWTAKQLRDEGFPSDIVDAVELLSRQVEDGPGDAGYAAFIERIYAAKGRAGALARRIKRRDLEDNMNLLRLAGSTEADWARMRRYHAAYLRLVEKV
ncbi:MAG: HD domain-containing protein [Armatimonadaceae bacterium]